MPRTLFFPRGSSVLYPGLLQKTMQTTCYHTGDDGDSEYGLTPSYTVLTAGQYSGTTAVDVAHYAAPTISFSHGLRQAETATVVATITQAGNATFTVTAANSVNLAAGKAISVAVALDDTAILVAGKARTTLAADADVGAFFYVSGTGATVVLTAKTAAANDITMNCAMIDGTCIGVTTAANSANTVAGDVTTHCIYDTQSNTNQTGTTTSGNKIISGLTTTTGLKEGMAIGGNGVGAASVIASIDSATQVTGTVNSTASNTVNITFTSAVLFTTVKTADSIRVRGSASNDAVYTVATGANASVIIVTEAVTDEAAGAYITICKRASPSNNAVLDNNTGRMWRRYTTSAEKVSDSATDGYLNWWDAAQCYFLHPADANLSITSTTKILKIAGGAGEVARYNLGYLIQLAGFANAGNNRSGGYRIDSVAVNGADLDIGLWTGFGSNPLTTETAAGTRSIKLVCRSIYSYVAAMNAASLGGYTDWRIPSDLELVGLRDMEAPSAVPNATAFPSWPADYVWSSTTAPANTTGAVSVVFGQGYASYVNKSGVYYAAFLRGS
jgi:hypothetical protein